MDIRIIKTIIGSFYGISTGLGFFMPKPIRIIHGAKISTESFHFEPLNVHQFKQIYLKHSRQSSTVGALPQDANYYHTGDRFLVEGGLTLQQGMQLMYSRLQWECSVVCKLRNCHLISVDVSIRQKRVYDLALSYINVLINPSGLISKGPNRLSLAIF